jgi:C-terminal processing protease CtpA/Prc
LYDPKSKKRWSEIVKPISYGAFNNLLYERWVESRREETERLSDGKIGYVHVRGMNSASFREVYSEVLGRHRNKEALIVDTRFNGGGWLHDDLATLLNGIDYAKFVPRGQYVGKEPLNKWSKPSAVIVSESNYSDAHGFPFAYKALGIGKVVGMPVPGTMTAVWWETQIDPTLYFGIPQVGVADMNGVLQENTQLEPDVLVPQTKSLVVQGRDEQLEATVKLLLEDL